MQISSWPKKWRRAPDGAVFFMASLSRQLLLLLLLSASHTTLYIDWAPPSLQVSLSLSLSRGFPPWLSSIYPTGESTRGGGGGILDVCVCVFEGVCVYVCVWMCRNRVGWHNHAAHRQYNNKNLIKEAIVFWHYSQRVGERNWTKLFDIKF